MSTTNTLRHRLFISKFEMNLIMALGFNKYDFSRVHKMYIFGLQLKIWKGFSLNIFLLNQGTMLKIDFLSTGAIFESV